IISDTSKLTDIDNLVIHLSKQNIKLDALIINAGMGIFSPIQTMTEADFDNQISTNLKGSFFTLQKLIPHLEDGASVVFSSSTAATANIIGSSVYAATKTAINKIAKIAANELADRKIRVNIISPGPIATPGFETAVSKEEKENLAKGIALKRLGKPYEIAKTILFLCSDDASFITGTEILVDGGFINYSMK
ncbi:MAG: SDR family oxidoreductase, partial [Chryseobacterium sp.]|nr:SDR family oxidoreductase [Candidatus Chryseobacterium enterohippi]